MTKPSKKKTEATRRDRARKLVLVAIVVAVALLLGWCGRGWFMGGGDSGTDKDDGKSTPRPATSTPIAPPADAAPARCHLRIDAAGVSVDGEPVAVEAAVARCKPAGEAELLVTGEAVQGTVDALTQALETAGVKIFSAQKPAGPPGDSSPQR